MTHDTCVTDVSTPDTSPFLRRLAQMYCRWKVRRSLGGVYVAGLEQARARLSEAPLLLACTHVAWWDGPVMLTLDHALGCDAHFLLDQQTVARLPWLTRLGGIPLRRSGMAALSGLRAGAAVLDRPGRSLWVFPQGRQRPSWLRPLDLRPGIAHLARMAPAAKLLPVALQYGFRDDARPVAVVYFGDPVAPDALEDGLVAGLARGDRFLDGGDAAFLPLFPERTARADHGMGARLLTRLEGR